MSSLPIYKHLGLLKDGSEVVDSTPMAVPIGLHHKSADMKLKEMLARELERDRLPEETNLDDLDFDLPDDTPRVHQSVQTNFKSKREILDELRESKLQKQADEKLVRKSAKTDRAKPVVHDNKNHSTSARANASEAADETED